METVFPSLLTFSFFAPTLLRVCVGLLFLIDGKKFLYKKDRLWLPDIISAIIGILLFVGYGTQLAALFGVGYLAFVFYKKEHESVFTKKETSFLALVILLSLLIVGAGALAFDMPY